MRENEFLELEQQLALLQASAEANPETDGRMLLYLRGGIPRHVSNYAPSYYLDWNYRHLFREELGLENEQCLGNRGIHGEVRSVAEWAFVIRGLTARRFCELEVGTHLFSQAHEGLRAVQVSAFALGETENPLERLSNEKRKWTDWNRGNEVSAWGRQNRPNLQLAGRNFRLPHGDHEAERGGRTHEP